MNATAAATPLSTAQATWACDAIGAVTRSAPALSRRRTEANRYRAAGKGLPGTRRHYTSVFSLPNAGPSGGDGDRVGVGEPACLRARRRRRRVDVRGVDPAEDD